MHGPNKYTAPVTFSRIIKQDTRYTEDFQWSRHPSLRADPFRLSVDGRFALHFVRQRLQRRSLQDSAVRFFCREERGIHLIHVQSGQWILDIADTIFTPIFYTYYYICCIEMR